jgi:hypothetical protein
MTENIIAIYSFRFSENYNDDNYNIESINYEKNIDYHFFTDSTFISSKKWKINHCEIPKGWKEKLKYILPKILQKYSIIIYLDSKMLLNPVTIPSSDQIFLKMMNREMSIVQMWDQTVLNDLKMTMKYSTDKTTKGELNTSLNNEIKPLTLSFFIRRNTENVNNFMNSLFEQMVQASEEDEKYILAKLLFMYKFDNRKIDLSLNIPHLTNKDFGITVPTVMLSKIEKQNYFPQKRVAIGFYGITRSLKHTLRSIYQNIFKPFEDNGITYDIFIHTYKLSRYNNIRTKEYSTDMDNSEYELLNPMEFKVESDPVVRQNIGLEKYHNQRDVFHNNFNTVDNFIMAQYSKKQLVQLIEGKEKRYDYVFFIRPDCAYLEKFNLKHCFDCSNDTIIVPDFHLCCKFNDRFSICNTNNYKLMGNIFDELLVISQKMSLHPEKNIKLFLDLNKIKIKYIPFHFVRIRLNNLIAKRDYAIVKYISFLKIIEKYDKFRIFVEKIPMLLFVTVYDFSLWIYYFFNIIFLAVLLAILWCYLK